MLESDLGDLTPELVKEVVTSLHIPKTIFPMSPDSVVNSFCTFVAVDVVDIEYEKLKAGNPELGDELMVLGYLSEVKPPVDGIEIRSWLFRSYMRTDESHSIIHGELITEKFDPRSNVTSAVEVRVVQNDRLEQLVRFPESTPTVQGIAEGYLRVDQTGFEATSEGMARRLGEIRSLGVRVVEAHRVLNQLPPAGSSYYTGYTPD